MWDHINYNYLEEKWYVFEFLYLRWECGQALAKPLLRWWKSLSLNMLSLKNASSRKNTWDTWSNDDAPSSFEGGSSWSRVRVRPPRVRRNRESGFSCSAWPLCERPTRGMKDTFFVFFFFLTAKSESIHLCGAFSCGSFLANHNRKPWGRLKIFKSTTFYHTEVC